MDGYVSKPIKPRVLAGELQRFFPPEREQASPAPSAAFSQATSTIELLARVDESRSLLDQATRQVLKDCTQLLARAGRAADRSDRRALVELAGRLRGMAGQLRDEGVAAAAAGLQRVCADGDDTDLAAALTHLETEIGRFAGEQVTGRRGG